MEFQKRPRQKVAFDDLKPENEEEKKMKRKSGSRKADIQNLKIFEQNHFFSLSFLPCKNRLSKGGPNDLE